MGNLEHLCVNNVTRKLLESFMWSNTKFYLRVFMRMQTTWLRDQVSLLTDCDSRFDKSAKQTKTTRRKRAEGAAIPVKIPRLLHSINCTAKCAKWSVGEIWVLFSITTNPPPLGAFLTLFRDSVSYTLKAAVSVTLSLRWANSHHVNSATTIL